MGQESDTDLCKWYSRQNAIVWLKCSEILDVDLFFIYLFFYREPDKTDHTSLGVKVSIFELNWTGLKVRVSEAQIVSTFFDRKD